MTRASTGARVTGSFDVVKQKLAFELTRADGSDRYAIRLVDGAQIEGLARSEPDSKVTTIDPVVVIYDQGSGELIPADGYDDSTSRGRLAMRILSDVYCDALHRIESLDRAADRRASHDTLVFHY